MGHCRIHSHPRYGRIVEQDFPNFGMSMMTLSQFISVDSVAQIYKPLVPRGAGGPETSGRSAQPARFRATLASRNFYPTCFHCAIAMTLGNNFTCYGILEQQRLQQL